MLILIPCFNLFAFAEDIYENAAEKFGVDRLDDILTEEEKSISGDFDFNGKYDVGRNLLAQYCLRLKLIINFLSL